MPYTMGEIWRRVKLHCPLAGPLLIQDWVQRTYNSACERRGWSFLRYEGVLTIQTARTLTSVGVTLGSPAVTSAALFVTGDVGRQFRVGTPVYTIIAFTDASTITLDRAYGDATTLTAVATILDAYAVMPADFGRFILVADPYNQRRIIHDLTTDQLHRIDPARTSTDANVRALADLRLSTLTATLNRVMYEYWPYPTTARTYPYLAYRRPERLTEASVLRGALADRGDVLELGALAEAARWPGLRDQQNPFYSLNNYRFYRDEFEKELQRTSLRDDDIYLDSLVTVDYARWPIADLMYDTRGLRASDATLADYWGGVQYW